MIKRYARNLFISVDQLINVILGGDPDETLSSRAAKHAHNRGWSVLAWLLEKIDPGHLAKSREDDEGANGSF